MLRTVALVMLGAAMAAPARAQSVSASLNPAATIALAPVSGGGVRNLDFGTLSIGGAADTGAGSEANTNTAKWEFTGLKKSSTVTLSFTLPSLQKGSETIPVVWSNAGYGTWCTRRAPAGVGTCGGAGSLTGSFNPATAGASATTVGGSGNNDRILTVWLGARLDAIPADTPPGTYNGTVTLVINVL